MAKISEAERHEYNVKVKSYNEIIKTYLKREALMVAAFKREMDEGTPLKRLTLAEDMINLASYYILISEISLSMLKLRDNGALDEARNTLFKALIYLEQTVTPYVDASFSEYEDKLASIASVDSEQRYLLVRKLGFAIDLLRNAFETDTKWKWTFVDMEGRYAAVTKNIFNLKSVSADTDPRSPNYEPTVRHLLLVKKLLAQAAANYRNRYEMSSNQIDDFTLGINHLSALKRLHTILGESAEAAAIKKKLDTWQIKLDADSRRQDEIKKQKRLDG